MLVHVVLLGEEPLLQHCAELLLHRGHIVDAIVTNAGPIRQWALERQITAVSRDALDSWAASASVDLVACVGDRHTVPQTIVRAARRAAVGYHDGPRPRSPRAHEASWALYDGESRHTIVWHRLSDDIETTEILEQRTLLIDPRETSVSLNMRNAALALEAFGVLVDRLAAGDVSGVPAPLVDAGVRAATRSRPVGSGVIDWHMSAHAIERHVRACDFGGYDNAFAVAKIVHRGRALRVQTCEPVPGTAPAGRVVALDAGSITVAASDGALCITQLTRLDGTPIDATEAAAYLDVQPGETLTAVSHLDDWAAWCAVADDIARAEPACVDHLDARRPPQLPLDQGSRLPPHDAPVRLPAAFLQRHAARLPDATLAAFTVLLSHLLRDDHFDLSLVVQPDDGRHGLHAALCFPALPWRIAVPVDVGFDEWVADLSAQHRRLREHPGCLRDLVARHAALRDQPELRQGAWSPVAVLRDGQAMPSGATLALVLRSDGADLRSSGSIDPATLAMLARRVAAVAATAARDPARPVSRIDALDDAERLRQLHAWNATQRPFEHTLRIHDLFERQVRLRPQATALVCEGRSWSFAELDGAANRIAHVLQDRGIGVGRYVGLLVERGLDLVVAMLGVAKSGAAYVPIDPIYPDDRIAFMLQDAECACLLVSSALAARGPEGVPQVQVDGPEVLAAPHTPLPCPASATDVCYAIYTSGSTGQPKGVVLTHRAVVNTLDWVNREFEVGPEDRLLFVTSPGFDLSVYDTFGALGAGACVEVASPALLAQPAALAARLCGADNATDAITIWDSAPPALARLLDELPALAPASALRLVMLSGDWIPVGLPTQLQQIFPRVRVKSLGGATEAAIWSNHFHVDRVEPHWSSIPYGYPIQNARYDILDAHLRPMPPGMPGDLYIGGTCLAQGYLHRPELTAERFIADPHRPGERLYKTGDLARFWEDGTMEFLGRADFQVKIRGYRVELGEIEAALCQLPGVQAAVCTAFVDGSNQKSLAAYVQTPQPRAFCPAEARRQLADALPDYMVPAHLIALRSFPISANGKLDRRALPSPDQAARSAPVVEPKTPLQAQLRELWQQLLERSPIGITDHFFEVGGHSLLAVTMVRRIHALLGQRVALSAVISHPTIEALSQHLEQQADQPRHAMEDDSVVPLSSGGEHPLFFVYDGLGETLLYRGLAQRLGPAFSCHGLMPRRLPGIPLAHRRIEDMAAHALASVRRIQPSGPYRLAGLCAGGLIAYAMAAQLEHEGEAVELVMLETAAPDSPLRPYVHTRQRVQRLRAAWSRQTEGGVSPWALLGRAIARGATKCGRLVSWEVQRRILDSRKRRRLELLSQVLQDGRAWPQRTPPLAVSDIFVDARDRYAPPELLRSRVALVQATVRTPGVKDDEPLADFHVDPHLGWSARIGRGLTSYRVSGGHSTMLREPHVDELTHCLQGFFAVADHRQSQTRKGAANPAGDRPEPANDGDYRTSEASGHRRHGGGLPAGGARAGKQA